MADSAMCTPDEVLSLQPLEEEEELLQTKPVDQKPCCPDLQHQVEMESLMMKAADGCQPIQRQPVAKENQTPRIGRKGNPANRLTKGLRTDCLATNGDGRFIVFGRNPPKPRTDAGEQLSAYDRVPVVQQSGPPGFIQRSLLDDIINAGTGLVDDGAQLLEGEASTIASLGEEAAREVVRQMILQCNQMPASVCANPECPPCFCSPLPLTNSEVLIFRDLVAAYTLPGIAVKVSPRVVPLWSTYLYGGSTQQDLSASFGTDFMLSQTSRRMNAIVEAELRRMINPRSQLPSEIDIPARIPGLIRQMNDSNHPNAMNFDVIGEIPGNIAGGIGQQTCSAGAIPSTVDDQRNIEGRATLARNSPDSVTVFPNMSYVVTDTIDLCPGNCGAEIEQIATLPMSWLEASGVSGDVPFIVRYPSMLMPFTINA